MAVVGIKEKSVLKLELDAGLVDGKQRIKTKSFNKVKTNASDEGLFGTGMALGELHASQVLRVKRVEETLLTEE